MQPATTWPSTVAAAAPATPIFGKPKRPKIIIGSKMMLMTAPAAWEIILYTVRPVDCSRRSNVIWKIAPKDMHRQIFR